MRSIIISAGICAILAIGVPACTHEDEPAPAPTQDHSQFFDMYLGAVTGTELDPPGTHPTGQNPLEDLLEGSR